MEEKIRIENVTKKFGSYAALDGISLSFEKGKIHGMIGRNGSGKTVLFKCICGFLRVDDGAVLVDGKQIGKEIEAPESIGAIIETPGFLPGYSARQNLQFLAGIRRKIGKKEIDEAIRKVGLDPEAKKHVGKYSLGMRQRLGIAQTIMEEPSLLILDEPTNDLDIVTLNVLEDYLRNFKGCLIVISHDRYFMDKVVDHLMVFNGQGDIRDFPGNYSDYRNWKEAKEQKEKEAEKPQEEKTARVRLNDKRKMSFKEKREFEQLEKEIAELEAEKTQIEELLCSGTLSVDELTEKSKRLPEVNDMIDEKTMRWLELSEIEG